MKVTLQEIGRQDVLWNRGDQDPRAFVLWKLPNGKWSDRVVVDPAHCYPHSPDLLLAKVQEAATVFPIDFDTTVISMAFEKPDRMNACAGYAIDYDSYDEETKLYKNFFPNILVAGKSIPLHPGMTRYLAAHEYGHLVESHMEVRAGSKYPGDDRFVDEYIAMREIPFIGRSYDAGWHQAISEIIACDFRIAMCRAEVEFWPHPGIQHPDLVPQVKKWWEEKKEQYAAKP